MTPEQVAALCMELPDATEEQPFGPNVDVFKVQNKIFAILSPDGSPAEVSLKCEPEYAVDLRQRFKGIVAGYHLNKRHWNTISLGGTVPDDLIAELIEHSHQRVVASLPKAVRLRLTIT